MFKYFIHKVCRPVSFDQTMFYSLGPSISFPPESDWGTAPAEQTVGCQRNLETSSFYTSTQMRRPSSGQSCDLHPRMWTVCMCDYHVYIQWMSWIYYVTWRNWATFYCTILWPAAGAFVTVHSEVGAGHSIYFNFFQLVWCCFDMEQTTLRSFGDPSAQLD